MRAVFDNTSLIKDVNHVGVLDRAQPMRNGDRGSSLSGRVEGCLHDFFRLRVEGRGCFVEEENFGVAQKGASDGDTLLLTAGKQGALGTYHCCEAVTGSCTG